MPKEKTESPLAKGPSTHEFYHGGMKPTTPYWDKIRIKNTRRDYHKREDTADARKEMKAQKRRDTAAKAKAAQARAKVALAKHEAAGKETNPLIPKGDEARFTPKGHHSWSNRRVIRRDPETGKVTQSAPHTLGKRRK